MADARVGQRNSITRRWAKRGTRARAPHDQRTKGAYILGAIRPKKGKGAGLVMPWGDAPAMAAHLAEISQAVDPGAHAVLMLDQAGWHMSAKLAVPANITLLALPPRSPEPNPVENVWRFLRENRLSNRVFQSHEDIVAPCCDAWSNLIDRTWKIISIGTRKWAQAALTPNCAPAFRCVAEARIVIESWRQHYNTLRPHSSLGYKPSAPAALLWPWDADHINYGRKAPHALDLIRTTKLGASDFLCQRLSFCKRYL